MQSERQQPPSGICPIHCVGWYGNVVALRLLMNTGRVLIDYQDMYGNTALHYVQWTRGIREGLHRRVQRKPVARQQRRSKRLGGHKRRTARTLAE